METGALPVLNRLLVELEEKNGSRALGKDMLSALKTTIDEFSGEKDCKALLHQLYSLHNLMLACRPRMAHVIHDLQALIIYLIAHKEAGAEEVKHFIDILYKESEEQLNETIDNALALFTEPKHLLLHSHSRTIRTLIDKLATAKVRPIVYVAAQKTHKTDKIIVDLDRAGIEHHVVSEYSIVHILDKLDLAIFGALTLNNNEEVILSPGSGGLISLLQQYNVEVYAILTRNKFSYWREQTESAYKEVRQKSLSGIDYEKMVFSHDVVSLNLITGIIADEKIYTPDETRAEYDRRQNEFLEHEHVIKELEGK
ncbi:MAG: hypothetical protein H6619_04730 [Deltaproteobacteria bacterium]|nr:hypothetical protein [Deltaproteobacteria bacterium]